MTKIALAAAALFLSMSAFAAPVSIAVGNTTVNVGNTISGNVTAVNGGFSESQATDSQAATSSLTTSVTSGLSSVAGQNVPTNTAGTSGTVGIQSSSTAWNVSTGNANGSASDLGNAGAIVGGNEVIPNVATGSGYTGVGSTNSITANSNQGGYTGSVGSGEYSSTQTVTGIISGGTSSVGVSSVLTGSASVDNVSGAETVNSAALANPTVISVGDSGTFTAVGSGAITVIGSSPSVDSNEPGNSH
jgi:hypothetical protein